MSPYKERIIVLGTPQVMDAEELTQFPEGDLFFQFDQISVTSVPFPSGMPRFLLRAKGTSLTNNTWSGKNREAVFPMSPEQATELLRRGRQNPLRANLLLGELKLQSLDRNPRKKTA